MVYILPFKATSPTIRPIVAKIDCLNDIRLITVMYKDKTSFNFC